MGLCDGRVAIVTGGGRGIGREYCLMLAAEGAKVVVNDLGGSRDGAGADQGPAHDVVAEIKAAGGEAVANGADVSDWEQSKAMIDQAVQTFGKLDVLVNNAGILRDRMLVNMTEAEWDAVIKVHLKGTFAPAHHAAAYWRDLNKATGAPVNARLINTSSVSGIYGNIGQTNYGAAKMGIAGLSRIIAMEGGRNNVRANCLAPVAWTRMTQSVPVKDEAAAARRAAMAQAIRPDQPARLSVALVAEAAKHVTGQIFGASGENIILYSQPRPIETLTKEEGWTPETIISEAFTKMGPKFYPLSRPTPSMAQAAEQAKA
jgi:NAD(P)-dependent dehydrogenase (short-subunit alcohol dehydrogenase family)